jgi:hypothetical protein
LAAVSSEGDVIVWSYPSGEILFQKKNYNDGVVHGRMDQIEWNPFRPNVFAAFTKRVSRFFISNLFPRV